MITIEELKEELAEVREQLKKYENETYSLDKGIMMLNHKEQYDRLLGKVEILKSLIVLARRREEVQG